MAPGGTILIPTGTILIGGTTHTHMPHFISPLILAKASQVRGQSNSMPM